MKPKITYHLRKEERKVGYDVFVISVLIIKTFYSITCVNKFFFKFMWIRKYNKRIEKKTVKSTQCLSRAKGKIH